ncbi:LVIVD repeat protein [Alkalihalophilus pseudofirmus OF4]|uniref:LVIVD repeat protein n=2 Tax=Alkalihalophilus pseudofirmus TaxID=79885 RepID=D3FSA0_ALKPO|nr:LVIVD repeat protein [Alkalihalophilus pseudofirmus OF4]
MKKMRHVVLKSTLAGALVLSAAAPAVLAHDALDESGLQKGERIVFSNEELATLGEAKNEGSGKVSSLQEAASVQIEKINGGAQNNTADVYAHKGFAYLGTHTAGGANGGVRVFDMKDPSNPVEVAAFAHDDVPGTWQEKVIVKSVNTPEFKGDLAVVSVQQRNRNADTAGGFLLYDVTDPYSPEKLGFYEVYDNTAGTHELYLATQGNRALVFTSNPYADYYSGGEEKDFQIIDVTDPANPEKLWEFDPRDLAEVDDSFNGYHWNAPDGKTRAVFNHSVITDNNAQYAYVSMWDLGTVIFDVRDPENPVYLGRTDFSSEQQGSAHSAALARGGNVLIETREVYVPVRAGYEESYGYTRIFDVKDKTNPKLLSEFKTDLTEKVEDGTTFANTVHDPKVQGNTLYLSHYAGGVYMVDISDPANPEQIGQYVPDQGDVWGVFVDRNYVLASDMGQGLKVLVRGNGQNNGGNTRTE